jgi:hypothetical protein
MEPGRRRSFASRDALHEMPEGGEAKPAETQEAGWPAVNRLVRHWLGALEPGEQVIVDPSKR